MNNSFELCVQKLAYMEAMVQKTKEMIDNVERLLTLKGVMVYYARRINREWNDAVVPPLLQLRSPTEPKEKPRSEQKHLPPYCLAHLLTKSIVMGMWMCVRMMRRDALPSAPIVLAVYSLSEDRRQVELTDGYEQHTSSC